MNCQTEIFWGLCSDKAFLFPADHAAKEPVEDTDPSTLSVTMVCVSGLIQFKYRYVMQKWGKILNSEYV